MTGLLWASTSYVAILPLFHFWLLHLLLKGLGGTNTLEPSFGESALKLTGSCRPDHYLHRQHDGLCGAIGLVALIVTVFRFWATSRKHLMGLGRNGRPVPSVASSAITSVLSSRRRFFSWRPKCTTTLQSQSLVSWLLETRYVGGFVLSCSNFVPLSEYLGCVDISLLIHFKIQRYVSDRPHYR
jgi:hypothetical protein